MKVVLDAYWWVSGPASLRHVQREIVFAWSQLFPDDELTLVMRRKHLAAATDIPASVVIRATALWPQGLAATRAAAEAAADADLVLTHNFAASTRLAPGALSAVYLHDVLFATNPEWFTLAERLYFSYMLRWVRRAQLVFTSSASEAARIAGNSRARAVVPVGLGLSTELTANADDTEADVSLTPGAFVLTVGRLNARKNLAMTIDAALASGRISPELPLLVVGAPNGRRGPLGAAIAEGVASGAIRFSGHVSDRRLRWYYRNASLVVYLSLGEGFGMPPVEAAYFSAPTLVSDLPVFRETLGSLASYVDPTDLQAAAAAIARGIAIGDASPPPRGVRGSVANQHDWHQTVRAMRAAVDQRITAQAVTATP